MSTHNRRSTTSYLAIGSNLGDRKQNLEDAIRLLRADDGITRIDVSPVYETEAHVLQDDDPRLSFLNLVVRVETSLLVGDLFKLCKAVERKVGRIVAEKRWQPRTIDIDILLHGSEVVSTPRLTIPHPRMTNRLFVLVPLFDLAPEMILPGPDGRPLKQVVQSCEDEHRIALWQPATT